MTNVVLEYWCNWIAPINDFEELDGGTHTPVFVCDGPNPFVHMFLCRTIIKHRWRIHWPQRFPKGYVIFKNGWYLCLKNKTINGKSVEIFHANELTTRLWRKQCAVETIAGNVEAANRSDLAAVGEFLARRTGRTAPRPDGFFEARIVDETRAFIASSLLELGLADLEALAALLTRRAGDQAA